MSYNIIQNKKIFTAATPEENNPKDKEVENKYQTKTTLYKYIYILRAGL